MPNTAFESDGFQPSPQFCSLARMYALFQSSFASEALPKFTCPQWSHSLQYGLTLIWHQLMSPLEHTEHGSNPAVNVDWPSAASVAGCGSFMLCLLCGVRCRPACYLARYTTSTRLMPWMFITAEDFILLPPSTALPQVTRPASSSIDGTKTRTSHPSAFNSSSGFLYGRQES